MVNIVPILIISAIWLGAFFIASIPYVLVDSPIKIVNVLISVLGVFLFVLFSPIIAGLISQLAKKGIQKGTYPRDIKHPIYGVRRIYGLCWTQIFYFKPIYSIILSVPIFRTIVFRLFGYKGSMDITLYPDTWIRDLPLLKLSAKTYLSNRCTMGSNICLNDGSIFVDEMTTGENSMVGHIVMIAAGSNLGSKSEIGIASAVGIRVKIGTSSIVKPRCAVNHGAILGNNVDVGTNSYIGLKSIIGDNVVIPAGANIPNGSIINTQEDVNTYYSSETLKLEQQKDAIVRLLMKSLNHGS